MTHFKSLPFFLLFILLASCAKPPSRIEAAKVSSAAYSKMNCSELLMERDAEISKVNEQSAIGLGLIILPIFAIVGGDINDYNEKKIAQSRGKIIAIQKQIDSRCIKDDTEGITEKDDAPDSGVDRAMASLKELYFGEAD